MRSLSRLLPLALVLFAPRAEAQFVLANEVNGALLGVDDAEITPDGLYVVLRHNAIASGARVYSAVDGSLVTALSAMPGGGASSVVEDAVAVSADRAAVLGSTLVILDMGNLQTSPLLAEHLVGDTPRDLEITPDGSLLVVRGGETSGTLVGGQYIFELATGTQVAFHPGEPSNYFTSRYAFDVDSVALSNDHAICTNFLDTPQGERTRVTVWDLHPAGGGAPTVVYETGPGTDLLGAPHDVAITPDGTHAAVRAELSIGLFELNGAQSNMAWAKRLMNNPGPLGNSAMDSVEVTNERVATISRYEGPSLFAAQLDVFDIAGNQSWDVLGGDPHDLAFAPDNQRLIVRTHSRIALYDLGLLPPGDGVPIFPTAIDSFPGTHTSYGAGQDSIALSNDQVVTFSRIDLNTEIRFWDISANTLVLTGSHMMDDRPIDIALTPDQSKVAISGLTRALVFDLASNDLLLDHDPAVWPGAWPWCDGVVVNDDTFVAFGYTLGIGGVGGLAGGGWVSIIDLFSDASGFCVTSPNSGGDGARMSVSGSPSVASNDLVLRASGLPANTPGVFHYGTPGMASAFGDGVTCLGGSLFRLDFVHADAGGFSIQAVDNTAPPVMAGALLPGTTWGFQLYYRDPAAGGTGFNLSDGVMVAFGN